MTVIADQMRGEETYPLTASAECQEDHTYWHVFRVRETNFSDDVVVKSIKNETSRFDIKVNGDPIESGETHHYEGTRPLLVGDWVIQTNSNTCIPATATRGGSPSITLELEAIVGCP
jgi:hypothetical protein